MPKRENAISRHPEGRKFLEDLLNKRKTLTQVAALVGSTPQNVSQIFNKWKKKHGLPAVRESESYSPMQESMDKLAALQKITFDIDGQTPQQQIVAVGFKVLQHALMKLIDESALEVQDLLRVIDSLRKFYEFSVRYPVPEIEQAPLKIDKQDEDRIVSRLGEFCEYCRYRTAFDQRKAAEQSKFRMVSG